MTQVEDRLRKFEAVFARLLPDVAVEDALSSTPPFQLPSHIPTSNSLEGATARKGTNNVPEEGRREALPQEADGFDWTEEETDVHGLSDGMAALSIEPLGVGYLGRFLTRSVLMLGYY